MRYDISGNSQLRAGASTYNHFTLSKNFNLRLCSSQKKTSKPQSRRFLFAEPCTIRVTLNNGLFKTKPMMNGEVANTSNSPKGICSE